MWLHFLPQRFWLGLPEKCSSVAAIVITFQNVFEKIIYLFLISNTNSVSNLTASCRMLIRPDEGLRAALHFFYICFLFPPFFYLQVFSGIHKGWVFFAYIYKDRLESLLSQELVSSLPVQYYVELHINSVHFCLIWIWKQHTFCGNGL